MGSKYMVSMQEIAKMIIRRVSFDFEARRLKGLKMRQIACVEVLEESSKYIQLYVKDVK